MRPNRSRLSRPHRDPAYAGVIAVPRAADLQPRPRQLDLRRNRRWRPAARLDPRNQGLSPGNAWATRRTSEPLARVGIRVTGSFAGQSGISHHPPRILRPCSMSDLEGGEPTDADAALRLRNAPEAVVRGRCRVGELGAEAFGVHPSRRCPPPHVRRYEDATAERPTGPGIAHPAAPGLTAGKGERRSRPWRPRRRGGARRSVAR